MPLSFPDMEHDMFEQGSFAPPAPANDHGHSRRLVSPLGAAELAGVSLRTWQRMVRRGEAPSPVRVSEGRIGFFANELDAWMASLPRTRVAA